MKLLQNRKYLALYLLAIFVFFPVFHSYVPAAVDYYPTNRWQISTPEAQGIHSKPILEMMAAIKKKGYFYPLTHGRILINMNQLFRV